MDDDSELLDAASSSDEQAAPTASSSLTEEARRRKFATPLWGFIVVYVATALVQPTLTDKIRYLGGAGHIGWPPTLLATITNTLAMASLMIFADGGVRRALCRERASLRRILIATAFDFTSGCLLTTGLLMLGGGIWVVIYSSTTVWTAVFACCTGQRLAPGRWAGVLLVSGGMVLSASGNFADAAGDVTATMSLALGCASTLVGTMLHAAMFVYSELSIKQAGIDMFVLCASMGFIETVVLVCWNLGLFAVWGPSLYMPEEQVGLEQHAGLVASPAQLVLLYSALTLNNAVHAWAFFNMLERVGAVTSAVMKGVQLVLVFGFSFFFFCQLQTTQCFSWTKAAGVATVTTGLLVYACSTPHSTASHALEKRRMVR